MVQPPRKGMPFKTQNRTSAVDTARIDAMFAAIAETMGNLYYRWQDEKDYEDIEDYGKVMAKGLPQGFTMSKVTKSPFGFRFQLDSFPEAIYAVTVNDGAMKWSRVE